MTVIEPPSVGVALLLLTGYLHLVDSRSQSVEDRLPEPEGADQEDVADAIASLEGGDQS